MIEKRIMWLGLLLLTACSESNPSLKVEANKSIRKAPGNYANPQCESLGSRYGGPKDNNITPMVGVSIPFGKED